MADLIIQGMHGCSREDEYVRPKDKLIQERTEIQCLIADNAESCVALGCGKSLQWINSMQEGTINLSRRRQIN